MDKLTYIKTAARQMLEGNIIPFWLRLMDKEYGGFYGYMDYNLNLDRRAEKGCILNSRIMWFFSEAAMLFDSEGKSAFASSCREGADHAYAFLKDHCLDRVNGGVYWSMTYDGKPLDSTKHTYNQAFACYALGSYYRLTGNEEALEIARDIYAVIESHLTDEIGYLEAFTVDFKPQSNEKLSENGVLADKTMNTLLHVMEGYAGLYEAELCYVSRHHTDDAAAFAQVDAPRAHLEKTLRRVFMIYAEKIYSPELRRNLVFFDSQYRSILDLYSYGHDIESSWLADWAVDLLADPVLSKQVHDIDQVLADHVFEEAFDGSSLANECEKGKVDETRIWWVQAETVLGFLNQWKKTGNEGFLDAACSCMHYIEDKMVDPREGSEWFWSLTKDGVPIEKPIVEPWKCPYHNGRLMIRALKNY
ncbi:MAG: AGE family epimerase/isomerase [Firmicutes bacterium]|nr:AGE family epimerase/isomerase [Bacillota bacterium]